MTAYTTRLEGHDEVAEGTMAFHWEKPAGFRFKPGQVVDIVLSDAPAADAGNQSHTFSIVSAPFQSEVVVATRMRDSAFKRALKSLPIGAQVKFEGPSGSLTLHGDRQRPAVFIAGGIGITPFMSILRQAANDRLAQFILLLYSNRRPEDAAFLAELQKLESENGNFHLVATMTQSSKSGQAWNGETAIIDEGFIRRIVGDLAAPIYYVAGPPRMVEAMRKTLNDMGVSDDDIRSEDFYGY